MTTEPITLIVTYKDDVRPTTHTFTKDFIKIGRLSGSDVHLTHHAVARMHAVIERSVHGARIVDLGSGTGTLLNGERVDKHAVLEDDDVLKFGEYLVRVRIGMVDDAPEEDSEPAPEKTDPDELAQVVVTQIAEIVREKFGSLFCDAHPAHVRRIICGSVLAGIRELEGDDDSAAHNLAIVIALAKAAPIDGLEDI